MLRDLLRRLLENYEIAGASSENHDRMTVYESRSRIYLALMSNLERSYAVIRTAIERWLVDHDAADLIPHVRRTITLDAALCPRFGPATRNVVESDFAMAALTDELSAMRLPSGDLFGPTPVERIEVDHPGGVGEICRDPDGGEWIRGRLVRSASQARDNAAG
jgi:hypothetical protein